MSPPNPLLALIRPARLVAPNRWDLIAFLIIFAVLVMLALGAKGTFAPLEAVQSAPISLDPAMLPGYAVRTVLRMLAAMVASLLFTLTYGTLAAKSRRAEIVLIPILDVLQSVPILGSYFFVWLFCPSTLLSVADKKYVVRCTE